jgi:hypothetical protein
MTGPTAALSNYTADTRIMARCARGFDWNYIASGETITTGGDVTISSTISTAAAVGGRTKFSMTIDAAMGAYSNALKALVTYGTAGRTTGLGSAFCAETVLSSYTTVGTYAGLESEIVVGSGAKTGTATSFLFMGASGADVATFDTNGFLFELNGVTAAGGKLYDESATTATGDGTLKIRINGVTKYLLVADDAS